MTVSFDEFILTFGDQYKAAITDELSVFRSLLTNEAGGIIGGGLFLREQGRVFKCED